MKRVALLTTFFEARSGYSLATVAETQIRMLLDHGYSPIVLVQKQYAEDEDGTPSSLPFEEVPPPSVWNRQTVDLRDCIPALRLRSDVGPDFEMRVKFILNELRKNLADADVCITHDIVFQEWYKEHNVAVRRYAQERPELLWLHWIHSCPLHGRTADYPLSCRSVPPPGYIVYPNDTDRALAVRAYGLGGQEQRVVACRAGHAIDPLLAWPYDELTKDLARKADLLGGDVVAVYPCHLSQAKQPDKVVRLMAGCQLHGYEPRLMIVDWQSGGKQFQAYKDELLKQATSLGLEGKVSLSSRLDDRCSQGVPHKVVMELLDLSNVYIHPSRNETYAFPVHEAILRGNLAVLNHDFSAMRELYGDSAIYFDFGSIHADRTYKPSEQAFWNDEAMRLIAELRQNRVLWARTRARCEWTPQALWREFEQLLFLEPVAGDQGPWAP